VIDEDPLAPFDRDAQLLALTTWYALEDRRPEIDTSDRQHSPVFPLALNTTCEICNQPIFRRDADSDHWRVYT
jgi:hypothetical protein